MVALLFERSPADVALAAACEIGDAVRTKAITAAHPQLTASLSAELARRLPDAAETDRTAAVALMLEAGWPVDVRGEHGATALHWASWNGNLALLNHVLRHAPPLEVTDMSYGGTPLGWAIYGSTNGWRCQTGDYGGVVKALLAAGAAPPAEHGGTDAVRAVLTGTSVYFPPLNARSTESLTSVETGWSRQSQRIISGKIAPPCFWPCRPMPQV